MKHLVVSVSVESSLDLLGKYADILMLDKDPSLKILKSYESMYIRSHFSTPELQPQVYRDQIDSIVSQARQINPNIIFIDNIDTVDAIIDSEDKWLQYQRFSDFMPQTQLFDRNFDTLKFTRPIFKKRLSSHGNGVTWDINDTVNDLQD